MNKPGCFYGIGLGPGDPDLLTVRARRLLKKCDVICVPKGSETTEGLALPLLKKLKTVKTREIIPMTFPMTVDPDRLAAAWDGAASVIVPKLKEGKDVAFVTEGDPLLYSTFVYVFQSLVKIYPEVRIEIVPGVSSVTAAAARALMPLVAGNERLAVVPATGDEKTMDEVLDKFDAVVFLKVNRNFDKLVELVQRKGMSDKAVLVTRCFLKGERIYRDISNRRPEKIDYFSLLIVRKK